MTIQWGDTGKVVIGSLKTFNTTVTPNETLLGTAQSLGTTTPTGGASGDISYTIQASDLPTITPKPISVKYSAYLIICGLNSSGASITLTYNVLKNGVSLASNQTQTAVTNANYWTHSHYRWYDVQVGDTIEAQTWASAAGVTLNYYAIVIYPTRMELTKCPVVKDLSMTLSSPAMTKGNPSGVGNGNFNVFPTTGGDFLGLFATSNVIPSLSIASSTNGKSLGGLERGDRSTSTSTTLSSTFYPFNYQRSFYPSTVSFREILR